MERKGRPPSSVVRQNIIDLLFVMGKAHGYEIAKHYNKIFAKVSQRLIYYHLRKGMDYGQIVIREVEKLDGDYSWGSQVERIVYELTKTAQPNVNVQIKKYFDKL